MADNDNEQKPRSDRSFRVRLLDASGRVATTVFVLASDDAEAVNQVRSLTLTHAVEIWDGGKLVASLRKR